MCKFVLFCFLSVVGVVCSCCLSDHNSHSYIECLQSEAIRTSSAIPTFCVVGHLKIFNIEVKKSFAIFIIVLCTIWHKIWKVFDKWRWLTLLFFCVYHPFSCNSMVVISLEKPSCWSDKLKERRGYVSLVMWKYLKKHSFQYSRGDTSLLIPRTMVWFL